MAVRLRPSAAGSRRRTRPTTTSSAAAADTAKRPHAQLEALAAEAEPVGCRDLILVMGYCGLRPSETFALRRRHLDDFGQILVSEGLVEVRGRLHETDGKTHRSRIVPVPPTVLDGLRGHVERVAPGPDDLLFRTPQGQPIRLRNFRRTLDRLATAAGLPEWFTPYSLRHTTASLMAQRGVPVTTAAAVMGHDPAVYLRTYAHLYPGDLRTAALALDAARVERPAPLLVTVTDASACGADVVQTGERGA